MSESNWKLLDYTSRSGKRLFKCVHCGRVSATPDKYCSFPCPNYDPEHEAEALRKIDELTRRN